MAQFTYEDLGLKEYKACWDYQESILADVQADKKANNGPTALNRFLLVEHPHVYTLGKSGDEHNLLVHGEFLKKIEATFIKINRGGDITYHGPGQLVGYPIIDLEYYHIGVREYIEKMEDAIIATLAHYGISAGRNPGATGVWLDSDIPAKARKICAIGVRVSRYVTMHGFALNVNTDMRYFSYINPCGFLTYGVTSLERELGRKMDMDEVKAVVMEKFNAIY
ncbi:lipoyl(octanoyl) transferase LipB [Mangrovibacterium lignilyticum]|uniref:lipoyl(octanoyl) transferase LipB n=1 Tax=Mangrovibacterium lignilyticum TaxID=2668052 RepID=UPI0013D0072B|nr:lipoyl(octanoyl) transferase LipB [Mangrovibacterium lignilyticum]